MLASRISKRATTTNPIPVVMTNVADAVGAGIVPDLARLLEDPEVRPAATDAIQRIISRQDDAVLDALASGDPATRAAVLPVVHTMRAAGAVRLHSVEVTVPLSRSAPGGVSGTP